MVVRCGGFQQSLPIGHVMPYEIEELALFWESLDALDPLGDPEVIARIVETLASWAVRDPRRAPAASDGIRVLKVPSATFDGVRVPALRLAYYLDEQGRLGGDSGVVMLLHVERYDEEQESSAGSGSAMTRPPGWH